MKTTVGKKHIVYLDIFKRESEVSYELNITWYFN